MLELSGLPRINCTIVGVDDDWEWGSKGLPNLPAALYDAGLFRVRPSMLDKNLL